MATKTLLTIAEFEKLPEKEGVRYELDEGELVERTFPIPRHNLIAARIYEILAGFVRPRNLGIVFPSDTGYILSRQPATMRGPDISFVRRDRSATLDLDHNIADAPDLAVEVVSENDTAGDLQKKVCQYLAAGAQTVWVVYPATREVHVFEADGSVRRLTAEGNLESPHLLPGFSHPIADFFG
jgi:Uma2 family endonuclease